MGRSYLEVFFRHPIILLLPMVIGLLAGAAVGFSLPRDYVAGATVWADTRIPDDPTIATTGGSSPPSAGQLSLLNQLLSTRSFLEAVADETPLRDELPTLTPEQRAAALGGLASTISVSTPGPQIMSIAVRTDDPEMALSAAAAVLEEYNSFQTDRLQARAQDQADYDKQRLAEAGAILQDAEDRLQAYLSGNSVDVTSDPTANSLIAAAGVAQQQYADASIAVSRSSLALTDAESTGLDVLDPVDVALPQPRMKTLVLATGGGLAVGLFISLVLLMLFMATDRTFRDSTDAERILGAPVVGSIPELKELAGHGPSRTTARH